MGDAQILKACDVRYEFHWVAPGTDIVLARFEHHFEPQPSGFNAVLYEADAQVPAVASTAGDQLVWSFQILGTTPPDGSIPDGGTKESVYIPNGDGPLTKGRYPSITLPR